MVKYQLVTALTGLVATLPSALASEYGAIHLPATRRSHPISRTDQLLKRSFVERDSPNQFTGVPFKPTPSHTSALPPLYTQAADGKTEVIPIYNFDQGISYTIDVNVEGTNLTLIVDTGSAVFWAPASNCETCKNASMVLTTMTGDNSTGSCNATFSYGLGNAAGCKTTADVSIGGGSWAIDDFQLTAVTVIDEGLSLQGVGMSGIMGVSTNAVVNPSNGNETFPSALYRKGLIDEPTMGLYIARGEGSEVTFGNVSLSCKIDTSSSVKLPHTPPTGGQFANPPLNGLYFVEMGGLKVDEKQVADATPILLDAGTSFIVIPPSHLQNISTAIYGDAVKLVGDRYLSVPCNLTVPSFSISFGGVEWPVDTADLISVPTIDDPTMCLAALQASPDEFFWVMGSPVMRNFFTAHDLQTGDITIYPIKK